MHRVYKKLIDYIIILIGLNVCLGTLALTVQNGYLFVIPMFFGSLGTLMAMVYDCGR